MPPNTAWKSFIFLFLALGGLWRTTAINQWIELNWIKNNDKHDLKRTSPSLSLSLAPAIATGRCHWSRKWPIVTVFHLFYIFITLLLWNQLMIACYTHISSGPVLGQQATSSSLITDHWNAAVHCVGKGLVYNGKQQQQQRQGIATRATDRADA